MSFIKRLGNVGRGWVSTQVKGLRGDEDAEREAALEEARATLAGGQRRAPRASDEQATQLADEARAAVERARELASAEPEVHEAPERDELGLPEPKARTL